MIEMKQAVVQRVRRRDQRKSVGWLSERVLLGTLAHSLVAMLLSS